MKKLLISTFAVGCLLTELSCFAQESATLLEQKATKREETVADKKLSAASPESIKKWAECLRGCGFASSGRKTGLLTLSGDVRVRWICSKETVDTHPTTGTPTTTDFTLNRYGTEFNCNVNYELDRTWISTRTRWAAVGGMDSRTSVLDKGVLGYAFLEKPEHKQRAYFEVGRVSLGSVFESGLQFDSYFDGLRLAYSRSVPICGSSARVMVHGGPFVINSQNKQYGWVAEAGLSNLKGFKAKYSFIDWQTFTVPSTTVPSASSLRFEYQVSQLVLGYEGQVGCKMNLPYSVTAGGLINTAAVATSTTLNKKLNTAWYVNGTVGRLQKPGDLSLTVQYERVGALAIPESDVSGIGHGNAQRFFFVDAIAEGYDPADANGATNYQGVSLNLGCAISKSLALRGVYQYSKPWNSNLGHTFTFSRGQLLLSSSF